MSGFESRWLDLREPVDRRSRDAGLLDKAAAFAAEAPDPLLVDLGCGTGSTLRAMAPLLPAARWRLVDNDPALLAEAESRAGAAAVETLRCDLADLSAAPLEGARLVTASALFDLTSRAFVEALADRLASLGAGLYAVLSYDGDVRWSAPHPLDLAVVAAFNRHQRGDKGFGPALGPDSGAALAEAFAARGFAVTTASTPWLLGPEDADLMCAFADGMARAAGEIGTLACDDLEEWRAARLDAAPHSRCTIGHRDVLALPPR
ncbi:trans-aconitate 2-methyltransferase [Jiella sp. M17.18]|uniref:class I SAM-dependent methyltransferase n=1 Tax=Jiella sp. M17.18 TaxID=3234247 RepID=UPI0034DE4AF0